MHNRIVLEGQNQQVARKVRPFAHRNSGPTHRDRHSCQYGREASGNGVLRCTVIIRPLQDANGYDFAQRTHYVREKPPMVKGEEVNGGVSKGQQERQQAGLVEPISSTAQD